MKFSIIRSSLQEDKSNIINFWKKNFPKWPEEKFSWFYEKNPFGPAACWTIKDAKSSLVLGASAIFPRRFFINGRSLTGGITGDFGVNPKYRIVGPALQLQKAGISACNEGVFDFLYGYPNKKSEPVQRRAGFKKIGSTHRMVKILSSEYYLARRIKLPLFAKPASKLFDFVLKFSEKETYYKRKDSLSFELLSNFDQRFDNLWKKALNQYPIIGERTSEFLTWRFKQCNYKKYNIFAMMAKTTGDVVGYIIYYNVGNNVNIADLFVQEINRYIDALISEFLLFQRKNSVDTVSAILFGNEDLTKKLKEYRFSTRNDSRDIVLYVPPDSPYSSDLSDINKWYLMEGDND